MTEIRAKLDDGKIVLDLGDALSSLELRQKIEVALHLACMPDVMSAVVDQIIEDYTDPLGQGIWNGVQGAINAQRVRILSKLDTIRMEAVKHFMERERIAKDQAERERAYAWRLVAAWPRDREGHQIVPMPNGPPWYSSPWPTEAEAVAALAAEDAKQASKETA